MPSSQQKPEPTFSMGMKESFNLLTWLVAVAAMCVQPFIRCRMGKRGLGTQGGLALIAIPAYAAATNSPEMLTYCQAWLVFAIYRRITYDKIQDTNFLGWPLFYRWIPGDRAPYAIEAVLVFIIGSYLTGWSQSVGQFVVYCSVALAIQYVFQNAAVERQKEAAHNAIVQMGIIQQRMNETRQQGR